MQEAVLLGATSKKVYVVQNLPYLTGEASLQARISAMPNVEVILSTVATGLVGDGKTLSGVKLKSDGGEERVLSLDGLFVAIGQKPENEAFADVVTLNEAGYIEAGEDCMPRTKIPGIFVAGDTRTKAIRQVTTATADGAVAALSAIRFIDAL